MEETTKFLTILDGGVFRISNLLNPDQIYYTGNDPRKMRRWLKDGYMKSSTVDFPSDQGMSRDECHRILTEVHGGPDY